MSKSLKFKNNNYLDSSSIVYNKETLNNVLASRDKTIDDIIARIAGYGDQAKQIDNPDALEFVTGFYRYYGSYGEALPFSWYFIIHIGHFDINGNFARQIWFNYFTNTLYTRIQTSGIWGEFQQIQFVS